MRALKEPESSEELVEMVRFMETARSTGMIKLNESIKVREMKISRAFCTLSSERI